MGQLLKAHGCKTVVISPGSRNAPLIITFDNDKDYRCISVPDERAAAFTAMGMTLEKNEPVAVICSSGSAAVNFYPAITEAFYQKLPLVVITADRPKEVVDQGAGQTIRQEHVFGNHIVKEANLIRDPHDDPAKAYNQRMINEALLAAARGPVHINVPFDEPLYNSVDGYSEKARPIRLQASARSADGGNFADTWNAHTKVLILVGQMPPNDNLGRTMLKLHEKSPFLVLKETVSNLNMPCSISSIDRLINTISAKDKEELRPHLLITMGGEVVSKMVKKFIADFPPRQHWHLSPQGEVRDTFKLLDGVIEADETAFFEKLTEEAGSKDSGYCDFWMERNRTKQRLHEEYLSEAAFSDLLAYKVVLDHLPNNSILHTANSASVRYSQLFDHVGEITHYANRGTSGIDGCTSTAVGHAATTDKLVTLITGDVAFLYDSNAFWNDELPANLRVIVVNNCGGNIFRIIKGPGKTKMFERFQETVHQVQLKGVADIYGIPFQSVKNERNLAEALPAFFEKSDKPKILEVQTPRIESPEILMEYFKHLKTNS